MRTWDKKHPYKLNTCGTSLIFKEPYCSSQVYRLWHKDNEARGITTPENILPIINNNDTTVRYKHFHIDYFGDIGVFIIQGKLWFLGHKVAKNIGYPDPSKRLCDIPEGHRYFLRNVNVPHLSEDDLEGVSSCRFSKGGLVVIDIVGFEYLFKRRRFFVGGTTIEEIYSVISRETGVEIKPTNEIKNIKSIYSLRDEHADRMKEKKNDRKKIADAPLY